MEDVDEPRCVPGADAEILRALEAFHLHWDGEILVQSRRKEIYATALDQLKRSGHVFGCACSRKDIEGDRYPGACRNGTGGRPPRSWRFRVSSAPISFYDRRLGHFEERLEDTCGDVVLLRADGYFAYQLAVVVDDAEQGVTHVVRGADLLASTPRQIHLQRLLALPQPRYAHVPVAVNAGGEKLSKQTLAPAIDPAEASPWLARALRFLGHAPPDGLERGRVRDVWEWAIRSWDIARVPRQRTITC